MSPSRINKKIFFKLFNMKSIGDYTKQIKEFKKLEINYEDCLNIEFRKRIKIIKRFLGDKKKIW